MYEIPELEVIRLTQDVFTGDSSIDKEPAELEEIPD